MAIGRTASLLLFFFLLYQSPAWAACDAFEDCHPDDKNCEARRAACKEEEMERAKEEEMERAGRSSRERMRYHRERPSALPSIKRYSRERPSAAPETSGGGRIVGGESSVTSTILASRLFVGPHNFPPEQYGAYGIVAFPTLSTPETQERFRLVCQAYWASLPASSDLDVPISDQMVTVWPVDDPRPLSLVKDAAEACEYAVQHYHLKTSLLALKEARYANVGPFDDRGPYLLAWAPAKEKGKKDTIVLVLDLSRANTAQNFLEQFHAWREQIESDPALWNNGFSLERVRMAIKFWVDNLGSGFLSVSK